MMDKSARIEQHKYVGLPRAELHTIAAEKVRFYQRRQHRGEPFRHLLDAWQCAEGRLLDGGNGGAR